MADVLIGAGAVALGALVGGPARFFITELVSRHAGENFPWGTLTVNVAGAFAIGAFAAYAQAAGLSAEAPLWLLAVTGVLGSFTTVSSFSLQTRTLAHNGRPGAALGYTVLSVGLCLGAAAFGFALLARAP